MKPTVVLSIAHTAVRRDSGRLRYLPLAARSDFDVHLVAPTRWTEFGRSLAADPVEVNSALRVHLEKILLPHFPVVSWYMHFYPRLRRLLREVNPDVIHLWEEPWSFVALEAALLRGDAALVLEVDQNILKRLPPPFEQIRRFVLRKSTLILSRSQDATAVVRACGYEGPVKAIGYGVDQGVFRPSTERRRTPGEPLRICYVGRLIEEKGLDDALEAMTLARHPVVLAIMGEGPHESALRKRIEDLGLGGQVTLRGWGSRAEVAAFLQDADVSVLLTRTTSAVREQFGRAIIESQSCRIPVIGSTCGAIPDVIGPGGWIVPERAPEAVAAVFDRLSEQPAEVSACAAAGEANVMTRFTYATVALTLAEAMKEAAALNEAARGRAAAPGYGRVSIL